MRISDWSSDVCSSDLLDRLRQQASHSGKREVSFGTGSDAGKGCFVPVLHVHSSAIAMTDRASGLRITTGTGPSSRLRDLTHGEEIGRASCRARVCQYV